MSNRYFRAIDWLEKQFCVTLQGHVCKPHPCNTCPWSNQSFLHVHLWRYWGLEGKVTSAAELVVRFGRVTVHGNKWCNLVGGERRCCRRLHAMPWAASGGGIEKLITSCM